MLNPSHYGVSASDEDKVLDALAASHQMRCTVRILDRTEKPITELVPDMISGAVQVDATGDVSRSLSMELLDPWHKLQFDADNPAKAALYADNFVQALYGLWVDELDRWVDIPVFVGPVTAFSRNGAVVSIEAQGKESLGLDPHFVIHHYTIRKRTTVANAIRKVMGDVGESKYALGMISGRLNKARSVTPGEQPWQVLVGGGQDGAGADKPSIMSKAGGNFLLFFDGRGTLTAKRRNANNQFTFDYRKHVVSQPGYAYDVLAFKNHAEVKGGVVKGQKRHAHGEWTLPATHPLSPASLSRSSDNVPGRFMTIFFEADGLKTDAACRDKAERLVRAAAFEGVAATFDSLPIPMLEEYDPVTLEMGTYQLEFKLTNFTIPLTADTPMSIGFNRRSKLPKKRQRAY